MFLYKLSHLLVLYISVIPELEVLDILDYFSFSVRASRASISPSAACVKHGVCSMKTPANAEVCRLDLALKNAFMVLMFVQIFTYFEQPK